MQIQVLMSSNIVRLQQVWYPPSGRSHARPAERPLGWGRCSLRRGPGDGWDQWRLPRFSFLKFFFFLSKESSLNIYFMVFTSAGRLSGNNPIPLFTRTWSIFKASRFVFLSNQRSLLGHMVVFRTEGDECGAGEPDDTAEDNCRAVGQLFSLRRV